MKKVERLISKLNGRYSCAARWRLANMGHRAVPDLVKALETPNPALRELIIKVLRENRNAQSARAIEKHLYDCDEVVRIAAIEALIDRPNVPSAETISPLLTDPEPEMRMNAIIALNYVEPFVPPEQLPDLLRDSTRYVRRSAYWFLDNFDAESLVPIMLSGCRDSIATLRHCVVLCISRYPRPEVIEILIELLVDDSLEVRGTAANALANIIDVAISGVPLEPEPIRHGRAVPSRPSLRTLTSSETNFLNSVLSLDIIDAINKNLSDLEGHIKLHVNSDHDSYQVALSERVHVVGETHIRRNPKRDVRLRKQPKEPMTSLRMFHNTLAFEVHPGCFEERIEHIRDLKKRGTEAAVGTLIQYLSDGSAEIRSYASCVLRDLKAARCAEHLSQLLSDPEESVRFRAAYNLAVFGVDAGYSAITPYAVDPDSNSRAMAARVFKNYPCDASVNILHQLLNDKHPATRSSAATSLARIGDASSIPLLMSLYLNDYKYVTRAARAAVKKIKARECGANLK